MTLQAGPGFLLTLGTIRSAPLLAGWQWAFSWLVIGPVVGVVALLKFRPSETVQLVT